MSTKEKTRIGGNRAGFISKNLDVNAMSEIYQVSTNKATARTKWIAFDMQLFNNSLPRIPACYAIYLDGTLSYVGQTSDFGKRMSMHGIRLSYGNAVITKWGTFESVVIKASFGGRLGEWAMREIRLIHRLQPRLNCVGSTRKRAAQ